MNRLTRFDNHTQYETFKEGDKFTKANVSICDTDYHIHYDGTYYPNEYLTIEALDDGYLLCSWTGNDSWSVSYSTNGGKTWTRCTNGNTQPESSRIPISAGQKILLKGELNNDVNSSAYGETIRIDVIDENADNIDFNVSGNLLSIGYGDDFIGKTKFTNSMFYLARMFAETNVVSAKNLIIPQPSLSYVYAEMFSSCDKLIEAPKLPHTSLTEGCYEFMFSGCISLPEAPELPAKTLKHACYKDMFNGCTSLVSAPDLPALTLADRCYYQMFIDCYNLNYVNARFISHPYDFNSPLSAWLYGVSETGTFIKNGDANWSDYYNKYFIPAGWNVIMTQPTHINQEVYN